MSTRLLAVSVAAINEPHRRAYDMMGRVLGWDVHIAHPRALSFLPDQPVTQFAPKPPDAVYELHPLDLGFYGQQRLHFYVGLERLVARLRPNLVFAEYDPGSVPILQARLHRKAQRIIAFTVENIARERFREVTRNLLSLQMRAAARDGLVGSLQAAGWAATDGLACISPEGKQVFEGLGWSKPIEVVPLGTDMADFVPGDEAQLRAELGLVDRFVVGYFGRLVPEKGVHVLIDAIAKTDNSVTLLLDMYRNFAPGSYAQMLMGSVERLGLQHRVRTFDAPHAAIARYMRCADVVVLPSLTTERWKEQYGRVLPEAMACEVAVVGTRSGNIPEMIGDAGLLVPENDSDALAAAIESLRMDRAQRLALAKAGRARVMQKFSLEAQSHAMHRLALKLN